MIRGTTPTLEFVLPFDTVDIAEAYITFMQRGIVKLDIPISECDTDKNVITVRLTQEQTLLLSVKSDVEIQIRCRDRAGNATASEIIRTDCGRILKDGVI